MRHKYIILGLLGLLIVLIILKVSGPTQFPMSVKSEFGKSEKVVKAAETFLENRAEPTGNTIKWASFQIGNSREQVGAPSDFVQNDTVVLGGKTIPCATTYFYGADNQLIEVHYSFTHFGIVIGPITSKVLELFGDHHIRIYRYNQYMHANEMDKYIWLDGNNLVLYEVESSLNDSYLSIMDVSSLSQEQLAKYISSVRINGYHPYQPHLKGYLERENERSSGRSNSSSTRTYKYGDSDTYQGSSQQKADLKAIDDYFGF